MFRPSIPSFPMRQVQLLKGDTLAIFLTSLADGSPKSGIVSGDIVLYLRKDGGNPVEKTINGSNFREVDSVFMPGVYEVDFSTADFDTRGELVFSISENGGVDLAPYLEIIQVGDFASGLVTLDAYDLTLGSDLIFNFPIFRDGGPLVGLSSSDIEVDLYEQGTLISNTISTTLEEVGQGLYKATLEGDTLSNQGDSLVRVRSLNDIPESVDSLSHSSNNGTDIFATVLGAKNALVAVCDVDLNNSVRISTDRGQTFTSSEYVDSVDVHKAYGVTGYQNDEDVLVLSVYNVTDSAAESYYTLDRGETWTQSTDLAADSYAGVRKVSIQPVGNEYYMIGALTAGGSSVLLGSLIANSMVLEDTFATVDLYDVSYYNIGAAIIVGEDVSNNGFVRTLSLGSFVAPSTLPVTAPLRSVDMVRNGSAGWAVGDSGAVLYTSDDGDNWTSQTANLGTAENLSGVYAIDATKAYVVGANGSFFYTEDSGATWTTPTVVTDEGFPDSFLSVGYADSAVFSLSTFSGIIYEEGQTFPKFDHTYIPLKVQLSASSPTEIEQLSSLVQQNIKSSKGVIEVPQESTSTYTIQLSDDAGAVTNLSLTTVEALLFKNGVSTVNTVVSTLSELNPTTLPGWYTFELSDTDTDTLGDLVLSIQSGPLDVDSADQTVPGGVTGDRCHDLYASTSSVAYIAMREVGTSGGSVLKTVDGGTNWIINTNLSEDTVFCVDGVPNTDFVAFGNNNGGCTLEFSDDAATSFTTASDGSFTVFDPLEAIDAYSQDLIVGLSGGYVLKWIRSSPTQLSIVYTLGTLGSFAEQFRTVRAVTDSIYLAAGVDDSDAFVIRSVDSGSSWTQINVAQDDTTIWGMRFLGSTGWMVGSGGVILKTDDSGATFTPQTSGTTQTLRDLYIYSAQIVWIVGDAIVLFTSDGGSTWSQAASLTSELENREAFTIHGQSSTFWIVGEDTSGATEGFISKTSILESNLIPTTLRFLVTEPSLVDLSPVTTALTQIQGAGFDTATDSLVQIRDNSASPDLTPVLNAVADLDADVVTLASDVSEIDSKVSRVLGLSQENYRISNQVYDNDNRLLSSTIKIFNSGGDAEANVNAIATYTLAATYNNSGLLVDYLVKKIS